MEQTIKKEPFKIRKDTGFLYIEMGKKPGIVTSTGTVLFWLIINAFLAVSLASSGTGFGCVAGFLFFIFLLIILSYNIIPKVVGAISINTISQKVVITGNLYNDFKTTDKMSLMCLQKAFVITNLVGAEEVYYIKLKLINREATLFRIDSWEIKGAKELAIYIVDEINSFIGAAEKAKLEEKIPDYLFEGETDKALLKLKLEVYNEPGNYLHHYNLGIAYLERKRYEKALESFDTALSLSTNKSELYYNIGVAHMKMGNYQQAIENFEKAVEKNPKYSKPYNQMGVIYHKELNNKSKAEESYKKAIELNSSDFQSAFNLGELYDENENYNLAIERYKQTIKLNPLDSEAYIRVARCYKKLKDNQQAIEYFNKAIGNNIEDAESHYNIATIYIEEGKYDLAQEYLKQVVEIDPAYSNKPNYYVALGQINSGKRLVDSSIKNYKKAVDLEPENPELLVQLAEAYYKSSNRGKAIDYYKRAYALNPKISKVVPEDILDSVVRQLQK